MIRAPELARSLALLGVALVASSAAGCIGGLDAPTLVITPRILAITADHPESAPGTDVTLRAMAYDPEGRALTYAWEACIGVSDILAASQITSGTAEDTCVPLPGSTFEVVVPGLVTQGIVDNLDMIGEVGGFDVAIIRAILATAGLSFEVHVDVLAPDGEVLVSGYKRIAITTRAPTTNPPPMEYRVADTLVRSANEPLGHPFECLLARPIRVPAGERIILAPQGDESSWLETFPVFDYTGSVRSGMENAYYSFYATGGSLSSETTRLPDRDVFYRAPAELGTERIFLVVRDGHLGARACSFPIEIIEALPAP